MSSTPAVSLGCGQTEATVVSGEQGHAGDQMVLEAQTVCRGKHCKLPLWERSSLSVDGDKLYSGQMAKAEFQLSHAGFELSILGHLRMT